VDIDNSRHLGSVQTVSMNADSMQHTGARTFTVDSCTTSSGLCCKSVHVYTSLACSGQHGSMKTCGDTPPIAPAPLTASSAMARSIMPRSPMVPARREFGLTTGRTHENWQCTRPAMNSRAQLQASKIGGAAAVITSVLLLGNLA
jgi:hypothetical protein